MANKPIIQTSIAGNMPNLDTLEYNQIAITSTDAQLHIKKKGADSNGSLDEIVSFNATKFLTEVNAVPTAEEMSDNDLVINTADGKAFFKKPDGTVGIISGESTGNQNAVLGEYANVIREVMVDDTQTITNGSSFTFPYTGQYEDVDGLRRVFMQEKVLGATNSVEFAVPSTTFVTVTSNPHVVADNTTFGGTTLASGNASLEDSFRGVTSVAGPGMIQSDTTNSSDLVLTMTAPEGQQYKITNVHTEFLDVTYGTCPYRIDVSDDNVNWTVGYQLTELTYANVDASVDIQGRYIKITVNADPLDGVARIYWSQDNIADSQFLTTSLIKVGEDDTVGTTVLADSVSLSNILDITETANVNNGATIEVSLDGGTTWQELTTETVVTDGTTMKVRYTNTSTASKLLFQETVANSAQNYNAGTGTTILGGDLEEFQEVYSVDQVSNNSRLITYVGTVTSTIGHKIGVKDDVTSWDAVVAVSAGDKLEISVVDGWVIAKLNDVEQDRKLLSSFTNPYFYVAIANTLDTLINTIFDKTTKTSFSSATYDIEDNPSWKNASPLEWIIEYPNTKDTKITNSSGSTGTLKVKVILDMYTDLMDLGQSIVDSNGDDVGSIAWFGTSVAPQGYLVCDGSELVRNDYVDLFTAIGETYGAGNGLTTFLIPNLVSTVEGDYSTTETLTSKRWVDGKPIYRIVSDVSIDSTGLTVLQEDTIATKVVTLYTKDADTAESPVASGITSLSGSLLPCIRYKKNAVTINVRSGGAEIYTTKANFPMVDNTQGSFAIDESTKTLYVWDGADWDRVQHGKDETVEWTTLPEAEYVVKPGGSNVTITAVASDPEGFPVTYEFDTVPTTPPQGTIVNNQDGTFTITPSAQESDAGTFTLRIKASDGVNVDAKLTSVRLKDLPKITASGFATEDFIQLAVGSQLTEEDNTPVTTVGAGIPAYLDGAWALNSRNHSSTYSITVDKPIRIWMYRASIWSSVIDQNTYTYNESLLNFFSDSVEMDIYYKDVDAGEHFLDTTTAFYAFTEQDGTKNDITVLGTQHPNF